MSGRSGRPAPVPIAVAFALAACCANHLNVLQSARGEDPRWRDARLRMVSEQVEPAGVTDERVIESLRNTPRHLFVPLSVRDRAYADMALPIGDGQTISPPSIVAQMTQALDPRPEDRVLEIGTGSGYQAAVLSPLVAEVYSIEIVGALGRRAARTLSRLNLDNVKTKVGDGFQGWPEHAPFDKIIVTCSPENVPRPLVRQLAEGGVIVIPLGRRFQQVLCRLRKVDGELRREELESTFFVPMTGLAEEARVARNDEGVPRLRNGDFETSPAGEAPEGWYYLRQCATQFDPDSGENNRILKLENRVAGRAAQALQAVGLDGSRARRVELSVSIRTDEIWRGRDVSQLPGIGLSFFDEQRRPISAKQLGPWTGTTNWIRDELVVEVPAKCKLAIVYVKMFGSVGTLYVDNLSLRVVDDQEK